MFSHFGSLLQKAEATEDDLKKFHDCWQNVRYSLAIPTPIETLNVMRLSYRIISSITHEIAYRYRKSTDELEEELYAEVPGSRWLSFEEESSYIHQIWQHKSELQGKMRIVSKLGNKMLNPSNFCGIIAFADDPVTKAILANHPKFGSAVAKYCRPFLNLVVQVQNTRSELGIELKEIPKFMLTLRLRYHGQTMEEITKDWAKTIAKAMNSIKQLKDLIQRRDDNAV